MNEWAKLNEWMKRDIGVITTEIILIYLKLENKIEWFSECEWNSRTAFQQMSSTNFSSELLLIVICTLNTQLPLINKNSMLWIN